MKTYNISFYDALYNTSYANLRLLNSVIPSYKSKNKDGKREGVEVIDMENPDNFELAMKLISNEE